jgi:methionyl-tRNA formyltransferase
VSAQPRIVFLGAGGPFSCACLTRLIAVGGVAAVVVPRATGRGPRRWLRALRQRMATRPLRSIARAHGIPVVAFGHDLRSFNADLICTASFPHLVGADMRSAATLGAINVHSSLLPRHRGPDPLFWTYFDDDRESGVTVHWMTDGIDDGDVVLQRRVDVPRGMPGRDLYLRLASEAAEAMADAVVAIGNGTATRTPQPDRASDPPPSRMTWAVDWKRWPAERVWHFLRGTSFRPGAVLADAAGQIHRVGEVIGYETAPHHEAPGTFRTAGDRLIIHCLDGTVTARR